MEVMRLSEHPEARNWLSQFHDSRDRALAAQMIDRIRLVSLREFEVSIETSLINLQKQLRSTIAVYPVVPPFPEGIAGYDPFAGGIPKDPTVNSREVGRRRKYGSEDRVGHLLAKLQERFKRNSGASLIECTPSLVQLRSQGISHIVFVDDICGSGKRLLGFWESVVPRTIKSLLSLGKLELWIVMYATTPKGIARIRKSLPNFPIESNLLTTIADADLRVLLTPDIKELCRRYAHAMGVRGAAMGFEGSACPIVFEHGCPNNLPVILWKNKGAWRSLFPNRSIPSELRAWFEQTGAGQGAELLWDVNQPSLALGLLEALDHDRNLTVDERLILTALGLRLRGLSAPAICQRMLVSHKELVRLLKLAADMSLYDIASRNVTDFGREFVERFRRVSRRFKRKSGPVVTNAEPYYPVQCEGKLFRLGKTD